MSWEPLKRVASVRPSSVDKLTIEGEIPVRLVNYTDVYRNDKVNASLEYMRATAAAPEIAKFRVQPGDVILTKDSETADDIGVSAYVEWSAPDLVCGYHLSLIRPSRVYGRYLHYSMQSTRTREQLAMGATGVTRFGLRSEQLESVQIWVPPTAIQRAIADYLDAETARIDALISKKRRMIELVNEGAQASLLQAIGTWRSGPSRTLRQYGTSVFTGPFGTVLSASEYVDGGIPIINPTHISSGVITPEFAVTVSPEVAERIKRHRLEKGDLVMGRKGDVGRSAIVTEREAGWICGSDSIAIRCGRALTPEFLAAALRIDLFRQQLARASTGAMVANLNEGTLLGMKLPDLSRAQQTWAVERSSAVFSRQEKLVGRLAVQLDLLAEHRQALITAAVTGELDIPGAA